MKHWFTLSEAAEKSGLGNTTIRSKIKSGELAAVKRPSKHGHRWEISHDVLDNFLSQQANFGLVQADTELGGVRGLTIKSQTPETNEPKAPEPLQASSPSESPNKQPAVLANTMGRLLEEIESLKSDNTNLKKQLKETQSLLNDEKHLANKVAFNLEVALKRQDEALAKVRKAQERLSNPPKKVPLWKRWF